VPVTETDRIAPVEETQKSSSPSLLLSSTVFVGSLVEGACAILVASASAKLFVGIGAVAAAVKASRLHADIVRIPVLLVSAAAASITLLVLWNAWRARNRSAARWRKRPMTLREKVSFAVTLLASVLTLALVVGEAIEHPIFHVHSRTSSPKPAKSGQPILPRRRDYAVLSAEPERRNWGSLGV
jgi:hypothetical protein